jgi:hypothetical protein
MDRNELFSTDRSPRRLNEALSKLFGKQINFESFDQARLEDARNKLRTQLSQYRSQAGFNENLENDNYHKAQFMLDAINAELARRETNEDYDKDEYDEEGEMAHTQLGVIDDASDELKDILDTDDNLPEWVQKKITLAMDYLDTARDYMKSTESSKDRDDEFDDSDEIAMKDDINTMESLSEGEIQQASAIVAAKQMVDRVGRWIEELSSMENDSLLQLGDQIRDEMGVQQSNAYLSTVAPAIQSALETLKTTRETLSTGVRTLTGEEQPAEMLGAETPGEEEAVPAEPDVKYALVPAVNPVLIPCSRLPPPKTEPAAAKPPTNTGADTPRVAAKGPR